MAIFINNKGFYIFKTKIYQRVEMKDVIKLEKKRKKKKDLKELFKKATILGSIIKSLDLLFEYFIRK